MQVVSAVTNERMATANRLLTIQLLRVLAATAVVFQHSRIEMSRFDGGMDLTRFDQGALGVDLFFVISGFIMVWITETRPKPPLQFIVHRFLRVWPLYFVITAGAVVLAYAGWFAGPLDPAFIASSLFLIPTYRPELGGLYPFVVPGWSLIVEVGFYTLFGIGLFSRNKYATIFVLVATTYLLCSYFQKISPFAAAYGGRDAIMLEFLVGMMIAISYVRGIRFSPIASSLLIGIGVVVLFMGKQGLINAGLPAGFIVLGAVSFPLNVSEKTGRWIDELGKWSFALYLVHVPVIQVTVRAMFRLGYRAGDLNGWLLFALILTVSLIASFVLHRFVERPIEKKLASLAWPISPARLREHHQA